MARSVFIQCDGCRTIIHPNAMAFVDLDMMKAQDGAEPPPGENESPEGEEEQPTVIPPPPPPPPPGEGAVKHPSTDHGAEPRVDSGGTPKPGSADPPMQAGGLRRKGPGDPEFLRPGDKPVAAAAPFGDEVDQEDFSGHKVQGEAGQFGWPQTLQQQQSNEAGDSPFGKADPGAFQGFGILLKGNQPVTPRRSVQGVSFRLENPAGTLRQGTSPEGVKWKTTMTDDYGYIVGVPGVDGDSLDIFIGPEARKLRDSKGKEGEFNKVWVIHAKDPKTHRYDEDKVMFGYRSKGAAVSAFRRHYDKPDDFLGPVNEYSLEEFKKILKRLKATKRPKRLGRGRHPLPSKRKR